MYPPLAEEFDLTPSIDEKVIIEIVGTAVKSFEVSVDLVDSPYSF